MKILIVIWILTINQIKCQLKCPEDDWTPTSNCRGFYRCRSDGVALLMRCPSGLLFDTRLNVCNWPYAVTCSGSVLRTTTPSRLTTLINNPSGVIITPYEFNQALVLNGYPQPSFEQYQFLVTQACSKGGIATKQELAIFLAQAIYESDGLRATREYYCYPNLNLGCEYSTGIGYPGQYYYGRGYIQLSWDYNYRDASIDLFGSPDVLLANPDQVANNQLAWETAFWFWKERVIPGSYGQQVLSGKFGASTNAINGGLECRGPFQNRAKERFRIYQNVLVAFRLNVFADERGCYN